MNHKEKVISEMFPLVPTVTERNVLDCLLQGKEAAAESGAAALKRRTRSSSVSRTASIRGEFLRHLCSSLDQSPIARLGLHISGYRIEGELSLSSMTIPFPLSFRNCSLEEGITLHNASLCSLDLSNSYTSGMEARGVTVSGELRMSEGFESDRPVYLNGARIKGDLNCIGARFSYSHKQAHQQLSPSYSNDGCEDCRSLVLDAYVLLLEHASIDGSVYLCGKFFAEGGVQLTDCTIGVNLNCTKATFNAASATPGNDPIRNGRRLCCACDAVYHLACALNCDGLKVGGNAIMNEMSAFGEVRLTGAVIDGDIEAARGYFKPYGADAFYADRLNVGGNLFLCDDFKAEGIVRLPSAKIGKDLSFFRGAITCAPKSGDSDPCAALDCEGMTVGGSIHMNNFSVQGWVNLSFSTVGGNLNSTKGSFINPRGSAIEAYAMRITGSVVFDGEFCAEGIVKFTGSQIGNNLMCTDARFQSYSPCAFNLNCVTIGGKVRMDGKFRADGGVCLDDSTITSYWRCDGGTFLAPKRQEGEEKRTYAISAGKLQVGGSVYLDWYGDNRFVAEGEVMFNDCYIGRNLRCAGGKFDNKGGYTLRSSQMKVLGSVIMSQRFHSDGTVKIDYATIGGSLKFSGGNFLNSSDGRWGEPGVVLSAEGATIGGSVYMNDGFHAGGTIVLKRAQIGGYLYWAGVKNPEDAELDLRSANADVLEDDPSCWPKRIDLNGFEYRFLHHPTEALDKRIAEWLPVSPRFRPQPYEHLAAVLKKIGHEEEAKHVLIKKNQQGARLPAKWLLGPFVGYGYRPYRALLVALLLTVAGTVVYHHAFREKLLFAPDVKEGQKPPSEAVPHHLLMAKEAGKAATRKSEAAPGTNEQWIKEHPLFLAFVYSLDVSIPLLNLHVHEKFEEDHSKQSWLTLYHIIHTALGWLAAVLFGAAVTGLLRN